MKCRICKTRLDPVLEDVGSHPYCEPILPRAKVRSEQLEVAFTPINPDSDPDADYIKQQVLGVVRQQDQRNPRSHQVNIGPSELSSPCDRRVAYRLAGIQAVNTTFDPWPAIVGTAVHDWLENAFLNYIRSTDSKEWITETKLDFSEWVTGRSDLFNVERGIVVDYKGTSPDKMKKILRDGSPENYVRQVQIYGHGYAMLGYQVKKVALAYFPRAGNIKDLHVDVHEFDPSVGPEAVARIPIVANELLRLDVLANPHRWEQVDAVPSHDCGFCPWYNFRRSPEEGASDEGCPGK